MGATPSSMNWSVGNGRSYRVFSHPLETINERVLILDELYKIAKILEPGIEFTLQQGNKAYTLDKKDIYLCLDNIKLRDDSFNTLVYVFLHELSHVIGDQCRQHDQCFRDIFRNVLERAIWRKLYIYQNYKLKPKNYCNVLIK